MQGGGDLPVAATPDTRKGVEKTNEREQKTHMNDIDGQ